MTNKLSNLSREEILSNANKYINTLKSEIDYLNEEWTKSIKESYDLKDSINLIKINVINEFVKRIKMQECVEDFSIHGNKIVYVEDIDKIKQYMFDEIMNEGD